MYPNREMEGVSSHDREGVDNSKELEETKSAALVPSKTTGSNLKAIKKLTNTIATQTSLASVKFTLIRSSSVKHFVDSTTSPMHMNWKSSDDVKDLRENAKPFPCTFVQSQTSITVSSNEAATRAISLGPSLTRSRTKTSQDVLQVSASFISRKLGLGKEVLTVTTDYGSSSADTCSITVDTISQNGNQAVGLSLQDTYRSPRAMELSLPLPLSLPLSLPSTDSIGNNLFTRRTDHRSRNVMGSLNNCLRCVCTVDNEPDTYSYIRDAPPAYSPTYANHRRRLFRFGNQSSFVAPIPPPSYAQAQGICLASYSMDDLLSTSHNTNRNRLWSPRPATAICPRCTTIVVTAIEVRHSISTHITALALFLCGCWPCCIIPYCTDLCKTIDHHCPICHAYLGTYRPW